MTLKSWRAWVNKNAPPIATWPDRNRCQHRVTWVQWQPSGSSPALWLAWHNRHAQWVRRNGVNTEWIPAQRVSTLMQLEVQLITWKLTGDWGQPDPLGIVGMEGEQSDDQR